MSAQSLQPPAPHRQALRLTPRAEGGSERVGSTAICSACGHRLVSSFPDDAELVREAVRAVGAVYHVSTAVMFAESTTNLPGPYRRDRRAVHARQHVMLLLREQEGWSYPLIAALLGYADHTTVLAGVRQTRRRIARQAWTARAHAGIVELYAANPQGVGA